MMCIPVVTSDRSVLVFIFEADNVVRMQTQDPGIVLRTHLPAQYQLTLWDEFVFTILTPVDVAQLTELLKAGHIKDALYLCTRGFTVKPEDKKATIANVAGSDLTSGT